MIINLNYSALNITLFMILFCTAVLGQKQKVWLDADTGNEMDDLYALIRLINEPSIDLVGISSAHFNNPDLLVFEKWNGYDTKDLNTVRESQILNEHIITALGKTGILLPLGCDRQIGRAWGQQDARPSEASKSIIETVNNLKNDEKLDIITLGALSNIASALIEAPEILTKIRLFSLGARYNPDNGAWNKNEFNIRNDLNAFDYLLNLDSLDFTIMPLDAALPLQFQRETTFSKLDIQNPVEAILKMRWDTHFPNAYNWVMWDLAVVEAYLLPHYCTIKQVITPPENTQKLVKVYTKIDEKAMAEDFWSMLRR